MPIYVTMNGRGTRQFSIPFSNLKNSWLLYTQAHGGKQFHSFYNAVVKGIKPVGTHANLPLGVASSEEYKKFEVLNLDGSPKSLPKAHDCANMVSRFLLKLPERLPL